MRAPSHSQHEQRLYLVASRVFTIVLIARVSARVQPTCGWGVAAAWPWSLDLLPKLHPSCSTSCTICSERGGAARRLS